MSSDIDLYGHYSKSMLKNVLLAQVICSSIRFKPSRRALEVQKKRIHKLLGKAEKIRQEANYALIGFEEKPRVKRYREIKAQILDDIRQIHPVEYVPPNY